METLGQFLQHARKGRDLRLEDIAAKTRINIVYLQALDADQFEKFPSEVIARGFVRSYATSIGLDEREILTRFDQSARSFFQQREEARHRFQRQLEQAKAHQTRWNHLGKLSLALVISLMIAFLYWINSGQLHPPDPLKAEDNPSQPILMPQPMTSFIAPITEGVSEPKVPEVEQPLIPDQPAINKPVLVEESALSASGGGVAEIQEPSILSQPIPTPPAMARTTFEEESHKPQASDIRQPFALGGPAINKPALREESALSASGGGVAEAQEPSFLTLTIEAIEASWIAARIDDIVTKEVFLEPGEKVNWVAGERFTLSLGNAGGVKIELNGKPLKPFGPKGAVVKDIPLTRE